MGFNRQLGLPDHLFDGLLATGRYQDHRSPDICSDIPVYLRLKGGILAPEIGTLTEDKVVVILKIFVFFQDQVVKVIFLAGYLSVRMPRKACSRSSLHRTC